MITTTLTALFVAVAIATALGLVDCWLLGRDAYASLRQERALARAGFVPMVEADVMRLRRPVRAAALANRASAQRAPVPFPARARDAA
ncbi:hypothetical protein [Erythrobacter sp. JK5]|uniref:hypothetical protein n=1 Tax=Erythrobacter sp. JK5 TaxID=2829500 RepID=UPI001BA5D9D4|nr:hypothetical protein [Erythrobacter sp. JK5]QUL39126.1 hypothetical protein KDC96_07305 [Erythrobacter sp. JK5]